MRSPVRCVSVLFFAALCSAPAAIAGWSSDPAVNLAVADDAGEQVSALIAPTSDGGAYAAWLSNPSGNFHVYLQRLDAAGVEQWPHNGRLVSSHTQDTALYGWDMIAD